VLVSGAALGYGEAKCPATACREHARRCAELAAFAATPEEREHLLSLESTWNKFAAELESAEAFLKTMDEIALKKPYPPEAA
jgi:hypothetical protein